MFRSCVFVAACGLAAAMQPGHAAEPAAPVVRIPGAHARVGFERIRLPGESARLGLVGTSYLVDVAGIEGLSLGPAVYGAVSGDHGGFFNLGGEVAWRRRLFGPLGVELGFYAGGGGGGRTPAGGGLMLRPHADLVWDLGALSLGVSLSKVRFPNGRIDSTQLGLVVNASNDFRFVPAERLGAPVVSGGRAGIGFDRIQLVGGTYRSRSGSTLQNGDPMPRTIGTIGVRAEQAWGGHGFWGVEANRAGRGAVGGYAEYLGTVGVEHELMRDRLTVGARLALGMAGGGGVATGGGLLAKAAVYGIVRVGDNFGLALEGGITDAPDGRFRAAQASAALVWALDRPDASGAPAKPARTDFAAGALRFDAPRVAGGERPLAVVALKIDRFLTPNIYVAGQVQAAASGDAAGYSAALVGGGWLQPVGSRAHVGAELLAGAGGGGGVDGRGALLQPTLYAGWQLTPAVSLRLGVGHIRALSGRLDSTLLDLSLNLTYGVSGGD